jgi:hypothetical protein
MEHDPPAATLSPRARAFLDDLIALCTRHRVQIEVDTMYECVNLRTLRPDASPIDEYVWEDHLTTPP